LAHAAKAGNAQLVARLLGEGRDVNEADEKGWTALIWAAFLGRADVVRLLLARKGVEVDQGAADGATALIASSQSGHVEVVRLLLALHVGLAGRLHGADDRVAERSRRGGAAPALSLLLRLPRL
jgi:ankyrin repeat protein